MGTSPRLYGLERSVYTRVARMALHEKGVAYRLTEVEIFGPEGVPASHRLRHPFGRIPVIEHDGLTIFETSAITRYVDEAFDGPALQPADPASRARMNQTIGLLDAYGYRPMVWGVFVASRRARDGNADTSGISGALDAAARVLDVLETGLSPRPFLAGTALTLADVHTYPMLCCLSLVPEGRALLERHAALLRWFETMSERPSARATVSMFERK